MKKIVLFFIGLMLCMAFVSAGAAFTTPNGDAVVTPSGSLNPGQTVTSVIKVGITKDYVPTLTLTSDLADPSWVVNIVKGGVTVNTLTQSSINSFVLDYDKDITLDISLSGTVKDSSKGKEIVVLTISATASEPGGKSTYSSPKQQVYNPDDLTSDITKLNDRVTALEARFTTYTNLSSNLTSIDLTSSISSLEQAKTKIASAKSAGTSNLVTAYANIEAADKLLISAEKATALAGLKAVKSNTEKIDADIAVLYEKGKNTEAKLLDTKNAGLKNNYDRYAATYNANGIPNASELDALVTDSYAVLNEATGYIDTSSSPINIMGILPFIIIGVVAVIVILGIVLILKRRRNNWDELG